jgi:hypothetical protein
MMEHTEIVGCDHLNTILPGRTETWLLGSIGEVAVLDDMCCNRRPDVYQPATIFHANVRVDDGRELSIKDPCQAISSNREGRSRGPSTSSGPAADAATPFDKLRVTRG